jgi:hypothetical protein
LPLMLSPISIFSSPLANLSPYHALWPLSRVTYVSTSRGLANLCFSRRLCYSYISYPFELEKGMDGRKPSWVEILKNSVEHQNLSHCLVQACSFQNQNHKRGLTCTNCIHIL